MSADAMDMHQTWQEFIAFHSIRDSDEVYSNGIMFVPVWRVEQVMAHYHDPLKAENAELRERCAQMTTEAEIWNAQWEAEHIENARLRELAMLFADYVGQDRCEGCVTKTRCNEGLIDECWLLTEIREIADGLGIEVER